MANKINSLKQQRNQLLKLAIQKRKVEKKRLAAKQEEQKLRLEISKLKSETSKNVIRTIAKVVKGADTPERREKAKKSVSRLKKGFASFQKFANKHGGSSLKDF